MLQIITDKILDAVKDELLDDNGNIEPEVLEQIEKVAGYIAEYLAKKFINNDEQPKQGE